MTIQLDRTQPLVMQERIQQMQRQSMHQTRAKMMPFQSL